MAYAAYSECFGSSIPAPSQPNHPPVCVVMSITVPNTKAYRVRRVLANCANAGILRCTPQPLDGLVQMQVRLSTDHMDQVRQWVMASVPCCQFGRVIAWSEHLTEHRLTHVS